MKRFILLFASMVSVSQSAIIIGIRNFLGTSYGFPIVDQNGDVVSPDDTSWSVGTFSSDFVQTLSNLDATNASSDVEANFVKATTEEGAGRLVAGGLVNSQLNVLDSSFVIREDPLFFMFKHTPAGGDSSVMILSFGSLFPELDGLGNGVSDYGPLIEQGNILFGGRFVNGVDTSQLPGPFDNPDFSRGIMIGANVPEPTSVALLGLASFMLIGRRKRL